MEGRCRGMLRTTRPSLATWCCFMLGLFACCLSISVSGFHISMEYKPPVKSSVKSLQDRRLPSRDSNPSNNSRSSSSKSAFAGAMPVPTSHREPASFERRMREVVFGGGPKTAAQPEMKELGERQRAPPNVLLVETLQEYKRVVADEPFKVVAVRFFATYCKACKAVEPHFYRLAAQNPDVIFVDVPVTNKNVALHQGLGISTLPFGHIYHPQAGLVEELKLSRKHIGCFKQKLQSYLRGICMLGEDDQCAL